MGRKSQKKGERGEVIAKEALERLGVFNLERIGTPFKITMRGTRQFAGWIKGFYSEPVAADWRGELEDGTSVMCEVKTTDDENLTWGKFKPHQPQKLSNHKGITLVAWVVEYNPYQHDIYVIAWRDMLGEGFRKRKGFTQKQARKINLLKGI